MQVGCAIDLVFRSTVTLVQLYEQLVRQSVLNAKAEQVATFPGRRSRRCGRRRSARSSPPGSRASASSTASASAPRIETTTNDMSFFKHHRKVEHRIGPATQQMSFRLEFGGIGQTVHFNAASEKSGPASA